MAYKKLSETELKELYVNLQGYFGVIQKHSKLVSIVNKYFPDAQSILIEVDSEYNDETYDNSVRSVWVYGAKDIEIPLSRSNRELFNEEIQRLPYNLVPENTNDPIDVSIVIYVNKTLPEIYIKEK